MFQFLSNNISYKLNQTPPPQSAPQGQPPEDRSGGPGGPDDHRPPRNPLIERWQRAQMEITLGQISVGCGVILLLLGLARTGFARTERRYATTAPLPPGPAAPPV